MSVDVGYLIILRLKCTRESEPVPRDRFPSEGTMVKAQGQHAAYGHSYRNEASTFHKKIKIKNN